LGLGGEAPAIKIKKVLLKKITNGISHSARDYRTMSPYWELPVYTELIRAVWADIGDRPLLF
jgi:hypothetical protein